MIVSGCSKVLKLKFQKSDQEKLTGKQGSTLVTTAHVVSQFIENRKSEKTIFYFGQSIRAKTMGINLWK